MKKILFIIILMLLGGCGRTNANHKTLHLDDESIWNQYHVNMDVFSERFVEELTDNSLFFKMKPSISINSRTEFHGSFFFMEVTGNPKPYEFINKPKQPIDQFSLEIDDLKFKIVISSTTSSPGNSYPWVYITGVNGKLNYYILLDLGDKNDIIQNQYNESDEFKPEDKGRITDLISSLFSRISN
jgi:hypothetical protein